MSESGRTHLAPFREGPQPWLVLARNAIPLAGVLWLGWSAPVALLMLWFDGVAALGAMCALAIRAGGRLDPKLAEVPPWAAWLIAMALLGFHYWFIFALFNAFYFPAGFWPVQVREPLVLAALLVTAGWSVLEQARRGFGRMTQEGIHREAQRQFALHVARALTILLVAFLPLGLFFVEPRYFVAGLVLALSYAEIYPRRTLRLLGQEHLCDDEGPGRLRD